MSRITPIASDVEAALFMNSVPYPEYVPPVMTLTSNRSMVLGCYDPELVGCWPINLWDDCAEFHACFLRGRRGRYAVEQTRAAFLWLFDHSKYDKIISDIEERHVRHFARACGMSKNGDYYEVYRQ